MAVYRGRSTWSLGEEPMPQLSAKAIILGAFADIGASIVGGIPLAYFVLTHIGISGAARDDPKTGITAAIHANPFLWSYQLLVGVACSILGGYVAARIAKQDRLANSLLASWLCIGMGVYSIALGRSVEPLWISLLLIVLTLASYALGGYIRVRGTPTRSNPA